MEAAGFRQEVEQLAAADLAKQYPREASVHGDLLRKRGTGLAPSWRDFRRFLLDVGPCPSPEHVLAPVKPADITFGPGRARWTAAGETGAADTNPAAEAPLTLDEILADPVLALAHWRGQLEKRPKLVYETEVTPQALMRALACEIPSGTEPDDLAGIDMQAPWLPPEPKRRATFAHIYRGWRARVRADRAHEAAPVFLFAFSSVALLRRCREELRPLGLWEPKDQAAQQVRDAHPSWKKYCEFLPRASLAIQELDEYRDYSPITQLDALHDALSRAEHDLRSAPPPVELPDDHLRPQAVRNR